MGYGEINPVEANANAARGVPAYVHTYETVRPRPRIFAETKTGTIDGHLKGGNFGGEESTSRLLDAETVIFGVRTVLNVGGAGRDRTDE